MARRRSPPAPVKPVSGPGALATRTDRTPQGAAASRGQPVRVAPGGDYGTRQDLVAQQQAAPLAAGPPPGGGAALSAIQGGMAATHPDAFAPTERPNEPAQSGIPYGPGSMGGKTDPADPMAVLQAAYALFPHPDLARALMSDGNLQ